MDITDNEETITSLMGARCVRVYVKVFMDICQWFLAIFAGDP